ncbi:MAG: hypothetical protein WCQ53_07755 [bacterium]
MNLPSEITRYIEQNKPSRVLLRYINAVPESIRNSVDKILKISQPNPATLKQLIELAADINSKTGSNPLEEPYFIDLIKDSGIKDAVKRLRRIRMPKLNKLTTDINNEIKNAGLKKLNIDFDQSFESSALNISANIASIKDAEELKDDIERILRSGTLERIIKKYKDGE